MHCSEGWPKVISSALLYQGGSIWATPATKALPANHKISEGQLSSCQTTRPPVCVNYPTCIDLALISSVSFGKCRL